MGKELSRAEFNKRSWQQIIDLMIMMIITMAWVSLIFLVFLIPAIQDETSKMCKQFTKFHSFEVKSDQCVLYDNYAFTNEELDILLKEPIRPA